MSVQNPTIPNAAQAKGIDAIIVDLQTHLSFELSWLTNGMGRAYRMKKVRSNSAVQFLPLVYLGTSNYDYFDASMDNDKEGQSIILVGDASYPNFQRGFYGIKQYPVSIIFSANLETIDSTLLLTDDFTEHLMLDVEQALTRDMLGKPYQLTIEDSTREFDSVYSEFDINTSAGKTNKPLLPMTYFRFDCTIQIKEGCPPVSLDRCTAIQQNITADDLCNCIIPSLDYTIGNDTDFNCFDGQQTADLTTRLCTIPSTPSSFDFDGVSEYIVTQLIPAYQFEYNSTFTFGSWVKFKTLAAQTIWNKYSSPRGFFIFLNANGAVRLDLISNGGLSGLSVQTNNGAIVINTWYFIACTYNGNSLPSGITITINNVAQTINTNQNNLGSNTILVNSTSLKMGANSAGGGTINALVNDNRVWNTVLSTIEKTAEYNGGEPNPTPESIGSLVLWMEGAKNSLFGVNVFAIADSSNTSDGLQTVNAEKIDISLDTPT